MPAPGRPFLDLIRSAVGARPTPEASANAVGAPATTFSSVQHGRLFRRSLKALVLSACLASARVFGSFTDVAASAGLVTHPPATVETNPPAGIDPYVSGNPVCAADLDRDGWTDLLLSPTPGRLRVFMNNRDGTFREEGAARGLGEAVDIGGIAAGDFSNSGRTDVFLVPRTGSRYYFYVNDGTGHFSEQAVARGADMTVTGETHKGQSIGLVDFDRDGFLDIHVAEWGTFATTDAARYAVLLRNRGQEAPGHFVNVTESSGLQQPHFWISSRGFASAWADFDEDGYPDLSLISDFGSSQLWWNNGNGTFTEGRDAAGVGTDENGMGIAVADVDRDGRLDFFVSSFDVQPGGVLVSANRLFRSLGGRTFEDVAPAYGVTDSGWGWGAVLFDSDNDGLLDLLVTNGYSYAAPPWLPKPPNHIANARSDRTRFFLNSGASMSETGMASGVRDTGYGRGVAVLDYDNDGDEDVVIGNLYGPWILYRNDNPPPDHHWLRLRFEGTTSNRDGFGALVRLTTGSVTQTALYAPTNAYLGQREPVLHFGLGTATMIDSLLVSWPNGAIQEFAGVLSNQVLTMVEPELTTNSPPLLTMTPSDDIFEKDSEVVLTASAAGTPTPVFTWYKDGNPVAGGIGPELRFHRIHPFDAGVYTVVATNAAGTIASPPVVVEVAAEMEGRSVARWWNEALLDGIRRDTPNPPVHARNLYHLSAALWDAFWAYEPEGWAAATPVFHKEIIDLATALPNRNAAQREAMSHAASRVIAARFARSPGAAPTLEGIHWLMEKLGYDPAFTGTAGSAPAAVGNRIGQAVLAATRNDRANEAGSYADATGYASANEPMVVGLPGTTLADPNRWQPLSLFYSVTQNGIVLPSGLQSFVGVNARLTEPFALAKPTSLTIALDPGPPLQLGGNGSERLVQEVVDVIRFSSMLDPADPVEIDISPGTSLNHALGSNVARGRAVNPSTGEPFAPNVALRGDFARILAEYWADGPDSETPPGHWNVIFNEVSDHPETSRRYGGAGPLLSPLEWDVRGYLALNGALHDAACAAWTIKHQYDSVRPISLVRHMGALGQSSNPAGPHYQPSSLPLIPNLIELTTAETVAPGGRHAAIADRRDALDDFTGRIVLRTWLGNPADAANQVGGVGWILAERWVPYQRKTFVTPAFPGYVSGHSTFSRATAEVLALLTGSPFFPGGVASHTFKRNDYLLFEKGPSRDLTLQWATYYDAADQAGLSRLYGGIHISSDDLVGRRLGARIGLEGFLKAHAMRSDVRDRGGLVNVSTRGVSGSGERVLIAGFVVGDGEPQEVLVRTVGPGLERFGLPREQCVPDPSLAVFRMGGGQEPLVANDAWDASPQSAAIVELGRARGAFALDAGSGDAAEVLETTEGVFTVISSSGANEDRPLIQLVEAYGQRLLNVSTRGFVGKDNAVLIAGFALVGTEPTALLIRGIGPSLEPFGVATPLEDPVMHIYRIGPEGTAELVAGNDDWSDDPRASLAEVSAANVGAFPLDQATRDAALFVQLMPGTYTVTLSGKAGTEGVGLVEVYHVR